MTGTESPIETEARHHSRDHIMAARRAAEAELSRLHMESRRVGGLVAEKDRTVSGLIEKQFELTTDEELYADVDMLRLLCESHSAAVRRRRNRMTATGSRTVFRDMLDWRDEYRTLSLPTLTVALDRDQSIEAEEAIIREWYTRWRAGRETAIIGVLRLNPSHDGCDDRSQEYLTDLYLEWNPDTDVTVVRRCRDDEMHLEHRLDTLADALHVVAAEFWYQEASA